MSHLKFLAAFTCFISANCAFETFNKDSANWYQNYLASKTPYRIVANTDVTKPHFKDCSAKKIWMIVRHGTRNPGDDTILEMQANLPRIRDLILKHNTEPSELLRYSDLYNLAIWKNELLPEDESILTLEGEFEALEMAERMQIRFPELFPYIYSNKTFFFKYTKKQRTEATAKFFAAGLFGRDKVEKVYFPTPLEKDPILRFYKLCPRWQEEVDDNPETLREKNLFESSSYFINIIKKITTDLRLDDEALSLDDIKIMYEACKFETAWNEVRKSPWCSIFDRESLKAMEFIEDLSYYYVDGYGTELTYKQACPAFRDMFNFFEGHTDYPQTIAYFTHSGTLLKLIAHLGLYKDQTPPKHTDYENDKRLWRVSKIGAFATNLAFVLFECNGTKKVALYHQEELIELPACNKTLCSIDDIRQYYSSSIYDCDFEAMCSLTK